MTVDELIKKLQTMPRDLTVRVQMDYLNLTEEDYGNYDILEVYTPHSKAPCYLGVICGCRRQDSGCG